MKMTAARARRTAGFVLIAQMALVSTVMAQQPASGSAMAISSRWMVMFDGVAWAEFNHQSGTRGGDEVVAPNWLMTMASRSTAHGTITFTGMVSADPATVGRDGYRELFQAGETLHGKPLIDRQHPHDLFMQLAAVWRVPLSSTTGFTLAGGPAGEPALGPVAFMHRASAIDNPTAPLTHHTFDSTHVSFGVVTAAVDHGPWLIEGSVFNGREPDDNRWDFDFGRMDSVAGRVWFRPTPEWEFQVSTGHLVEPEALEPGSVERSTASAQWTRRNASDISSVTVGYGRNDTDRGARNGAFVEGARLVDRTTLYGRLEALQVETAVLQAGSTVDEPLANVKNTVMAFTIGGARDVFSWEGFGAAIGADVTAYAVPDSLRDAYGAHPWALHVFLRVRPPAGPMGRMWNMRMSQPMAGHHM
jgi:hypothetical protein